MPTEPELVMMKLVAVEEPTTNWLEESPATGLIANVAQGEVVPTPEALPAVERKAAPEEESAVVEA